MAGTADSSVWQGKGGNRSLFRTRLNISPSLRVDGEGSCGTASAKDRQIKIRRSGRSLRTGGTGKLRLYFRNAIWRCLERAAVADQFPIEPLSRREHGNSPRPELGQSKKYSASTPLNQFLSGCKAAGTPFSPSCPVELVRSFRNDFLSIRQSLAIDQGIPVAR
jgi:hypothetical protein